MNRVQYFISALFLIAFSWGSLAQKQEFQDKYPNGKTRSEGIYEGGFEMGPWKYYYEDGTLREEANYYKGKLHGLVKHYHPNGAVMVEGYFWFGAQDSTQRTYTNEGKLLEQGHYLDGKKKGVWSYYFPSGDTMMVEEFLPDERRLWFYAEDTKNITIRNGNGVMKERYPSGAIQSVTTYLQGIPNGAYREFYSSG
ncbi:MAG: toxin-antitoxin system YwqK family antitoxin, partial [Flavobacteriales bacterium]